MPTDESRISTPFSTPRPVSSALQSESLNTNDHVMDAALVPRRRRSSHFRRWLEDQHTQPPSLNKENSANRDLLLVGSACDPYLAYPQLRQVSRDATGDVDTLHSYEVVKDEDIPESDFHSDGPACMSGTFRSQSSALSQTGPSFRSTDSTSRPGSAMDPITPRTKSRLSIFQRQSKILPELHVSKHTRGSSLSSLSTFSTIFSNDTTTTHPPALQRMHHKPPLTPLDIDDTGVAPPRPSFSSIGTYGSTGTPTTIFDVDSEASASTHKLSFIGSFRSRNSSLNTSGMFHTLTESSSSSPSVLSTDIKGKGLSHKGSALRIPFSLKPSRSSSDHADVMRDRPCPTSPGGFSSSNKPTLSRMSLPLRNKHKKKLVISGIDKDDTARFEAAKRWCESFGEVSSITRRENGDLHINFRKAEVADTVCRLRAQVQIPYVGSVYLSWYTGTK